MTEIELPDLVRENPNAAEILRVWTEPGQADQFASKGPMWSDPGDWGRLLANIARFAANMYAMNGVMESPQALEQIVAGFSAEFAAGTGCGSEPNGSAPAPA